MCSLGSQVPHIKRPCATGSDLCALRCVCCTHTRRSLRSCQRCALGHKQAVPVCSRSRQPRAASCAPGPPGHCVPRRWRQSRRPTSSRSCSWASTPPIRWAGRTGPDDPTAATVSAATPHTASLGRLPQIFRVDKGFVAQCSDVTSGRLAPLTEQQKVRARVQRRRPGACSGHVSGGQPCCPASTRSQEHASKTVPLEVKKGVKHHEGAHKHVRPTGATPAPAAPSAAAQNHVQVAPQRQESAKQSQGPAPPLIVHASFASCVLRGRCAVHGAVRRPQQRDLVLLHPAGRRAPPRYAGEFPLGDTLASARRALSLSVLSQARARATSVWRRRRGGACLLRAARSTPFSARSRAAWAWSRSWRSCPRGARASLSCEWLRWGTGEGNFPTWDWGRRRPPSLAPSVASRPHLSLRGSTSLPPGDASSFALRLCVVSTARATLRLPPSPARALLCLLDFLPGRSTASPLSTATGTASAASPSPA